MADDDPERSSSIHQQMASSQKGVYQQSQTAQETTSESRVPLQGAPIRPSRSRQIPRGVQVPQQSCPPVQETGIIPLPAGSRGPRSLYLRRDADSFGFTLRHFIVYPPDSITQDGRYAAVGALREPMETIFVKQVYEGSPAQNAGLHHGDRLVAVNGVPLNGKSYQQVVQLIQHSPPYLHLLVVPKEDDVLQKFFPEKAHNPETNQRPKRFASPETFSQQRRPQSNEILKYRPINHPSDTISWRSYEEPTYSSPVHRIKTSQAQSKDTRNSGQDYSDTKDLVYRPIRIQSNRNSIQSRDSSEGGVSNLYSELYTHDLSSRSRAQPQVPPHYRKMGRRASEGSNLSDNSSRESYEYPECLSTEYSDMVVNSSKMKSASKVAYPDAHSQVSYGSVDSCGLQGLGNYTNNAGCRLSLDAGRRESNASLNSSLADGSKDSLSSYDSASTLTGQDTDDSIIMTRLRKTIERKEEFLKRPTQPINWKSRDELKLIQSNVIPREFYGRPQKLQKEWPPNDPNIINGQESPVKNSVKPTHQNFQRVKIDIESERDYLNTQNGKDAKNKIYDISNNPPTQFEVGGLVSNVSPLQRNSNVRQSKDKSSFVTTLSRIHESSNASLENNGDCVYVNGSSSLPNAVHDSLDERRYPPNLQIVQRRTRQFEQGRPVPEEEDETLSDRTNFYRSELSRLSAKRVVPNVAVRKREFETLEIENNRDYRRDRERRAQRESRSLDHSGKTTKTSETTKTEVIKEKPLLSGNLIIPIGNKKLHCDPPEGYKAKDVPLENENLQVQLRARSNSAESWSAAMQNSNSNSVRNRNTLDWNMPLETDEKQRNRVMRQDSYITALKSKVSDQDHKKKSVLVEQEEMDIGSPNESIVPNNSPNSLPPLFIPEPVLRMQTNPVVSVTPASPSTAAKTMVIRPNQLNIQCPVRPANNLQTDYHMFSDVTATRLSASPVPGDVPQVVRRNKNNTNSVGEEERTTRRVSYLKATWGDRMHIESDLDLSDTEAPPHVLRSRYRRWKPPRFPKDIKPIRMLFEESVQQLGRSASADGSGSLSSPERESLPVIREGPLTCKFMEIDGKRATDRSWHKFWATLKGPQLFLSKDRHHHQSPMGLVGDQQLPGGVDMRYSMVDVADDYTKRKNVLRISAAYPYRTELLLQAESTSEMADWLRTLQEQTGASTDNEDKQEVLSENKQAVPQQIPAATSIQVQGSARLSPQPTAKTKSSSSRNRSPTGQSPKSKTWRGRVVKQFKKLNQGSGSPSSPTTPEKLTFGVPLESCPKSDNFEYVPKFVEMCTDIIERKGLEVIGIYRVPGNSAAVNALTEELNKGINITLQDARCDTNVVSSLLKSFFRKLPDSLLTSELYPRFIEADKISDPKERLIEIKNILSDLPIHQYETLKHLILHLKKVVDNCEVNKMEARNLAIMFGPTLVRNFDDNMEKMVTDMSHQCKIVESLLLYAEWFFSDDDSGDMLNIDTNLSQDSGSAKLDNASATVNNTLLLRNISKIEGIKESTTRENTKKVVSSIISAANRKIQRKPRKSTEQNTSTKEEPTTPTIESKEAAISSISRTSHEEQKQTTPLDSEESSNSDSHQTVPEPLTPRTPHTPPQLMTYPERDAVQHERVKKFEQETMAMLQKKRRTIDSQWDSSLIPSRASLDIQHIPSLDDPEIDGADSNSGTNRKTDNNMKGSDLLTTMTSMFDNKIKALQSPISCLTVSDNIPYADESPDVQVYEMPPYESVKPLRESQKCNEIEKSSPKSFRDPSLHKSNSTSNFNMKLTSVTEKVEMKKKDYDTVDHKEKDVDEASENKEKKENHLSDELNELSKVNNFSTFLSNKELKCSASDSKLKRSESLNKPDNRENEPEHGKLKRSVSLNRAADRLRRSDSLTKYEKTESNINLRRELADGTNRRFKKVTTKLKRKNGMPERSIKRRHTVGGTKDFDKLHWLDNKLRYEAEEAYREKEKIILRSSSPDLTCGDKLPLESHI